MVRISASCFFVSENPAFKRIAGLYYMEMEKRFGKAKFYGMDPFHEGGNVQGIDLAAAAQSVLQAMKTANPEAVWVMQAWAGQSPSRDDYCFTAGECPDIGFVQ